MKRARTQRSAEARQSKVTRAETRHLTLEQLFESLERLSGLDVSVYLAGSLQAIEPIDDLPLTFRRHVSDFCRTVKNNRAGAGCGGHDSGQTNRKAGVVGRPFVQVCHAGVAEVIVPVFGRSGHLATVFIGQAVTESVEAEGLEGVVTRVRKLGVDEEKLAAAFKRLPRMCEADLLDIGRLADAAIRGVADAVGLDMLEREIMLRTCPAIRKAVTMIEKNSRYDLSETEVARQVFLDPAYFSRRFKRIMGQTFTSFVTETRIRQALQLLDKTNLSVWNISRECGYSRQSYFTRRFKQVMGMTPRDYRTRGVPEPAGPAVRPSRPSR